MNDLTVQQAGPAPVRKEYEPGRSPLIRNFVPGLTEIGKIKIGKKGEERPKSGGGTWQLPVKLDHFVVTTLERGKDGNFIRDEEIHKMIGDKPRTIPIRLMFNSIELNFQSRYSCYNGKNVACSGDGEFAYEMQADGTRKQVRCPCGKQEPSYKGTKDKCKMNGCLSCIIDGANRVGGVWKFRTTGYHSTVGITSSLLMLSTLTGGILCNLPLDMTVMPKVGTDPDGRSVTVYVVGIVFRGTMQSLQEESLKIATHNAAHQYRIAHAEEQARKLISADAELIDQAGDITEEFYPEEQTAPALAAPQEQPAPAPAVEQKPEPAPAVQEPAPAAAPKQRKSKAAPAPAPAPEPEPPAPQINTENDDVDLF